MEAEGHRGTARGQGFAGRTARFGLLVVALAILVLPASAGASGGRHGGVGSGLTRQNCGAYLMNASGIALPLIGSVRKDESHWSDGGEPPPRLATSRDKLPGATNLWESEGEWFRGCWSSVTYGDDQGTVNIYLENPLKGDNVAVCKASGNYICEGPGYPFTYGDWAGDGRSVPTSDINGGIFREYLKAVFWVCWGGPFPDLSRFTGFPLDDARKCADENPPVDGQFGGPVPDGHHISATADGRRFTSFDVNACDPFYASRYSTNAKWSWKPPEWEFEALSNSAGSTIEVVGDTTRSALDSPWIKRMTIIDETNDTRCFEARDFRLWKGR